MTLNRLESLLHEVNQVIETCPLYRTAGCLHCNRHTDYYDCQKLKNYMIKNTDEFDDFIKKYCEKAYYGVKHENE